MKRLLLFGCLNLLSLGGYAQNLRAQEAQQPRWRYGVALSAPLLLQFDNYANWDRAFLLEGLVQYRLGRGTFWPQLYAGYFTGKNAFERGVLRQKGFYIKPGMVLQLDRNTRAKPYFELNVLISQGNLQGSIEQADPVFANTTISGRQGFDGGGAEFGLGAFVASFGSYSLRLSGVGFIGGFGGAQRLRYLPGAGQLRGEFVYFSSALHLHLLRVQ